MSLLIGASATTWPEVQLRDVCDLVPGTPTEDAPHGDVPVLKPRNLILGRLAGPTDMTTSALAGQLTRYRVRNGDLLCARTGSVGRVGLTAQAQEGWIFGTGLIRIRPQPDSPVDPHYLSFYFTHPAVIDWIGRNARGTSVPSISSHILGTLPVLLPPVSDQQAVAAPLVRLNESIEAHQQICETTAELRDALLSALLAGDLPVN